MSGSANIGSLKQRHDELFQLVEVRRPELSDQDSVALDQLNKDVDGLLAALGDLQAADLTLDDYDWLSNALLKWQVVSTRILKQPREIRIPALPRHREADPTDEILTENDVHLRLGREAERQSRNRKARELVEQLDRLARLPSRPEDMQRDWHQARVRLAADVLDRRVRFERLTMGSYAHLEEVWLREAKRIHAYYLWWGDGSLASGSPRQYFFAACDRYHDRFLDTGAKGSARDFEEVRAYVEKSYLGPGGDLDLESPRLQALIRRKARQLFEVTGERDRDANWHEAEDHVRSFYQNLIPAVTSKSPEPLRRVIDALGLSRPERENDAVVDCFEAAVGISFLDAELLRRLWQE